jgi:hypothetical protein
MTIVRSVVDPYYQASAIQIGISNEGRYCGGRLAIRPGHHGRRWSMKCRLSIVELSFCFPLSSLFLKFQMSPPDCQHWFPEC